MSRRATTGSFSTGALASVAIHIAVVALYVVTRPIPQPTVQVRFVGSGNARVLSSPAGIACPGQCRAAFEPGTMVRLVAVLEDGSTFMGWSARNTECLHDEGPLYCRISSLQQSATVDVRLGKIPDEVHVAWVEDPRPKESAIRILLPSLAKPPKPKKLVKLRRSKPAPRPKPKRPQQTSKMTSVEVADKHEVKEAPKDAKFLSDKNRDVAEQTQARVRNLRKQNEGEQDQSERSDIESKDVGGKKNVTDDIRDRKGADRPDKSRRNRRAIVGEGGRRGGAREPDRQPSILSMRGLPPKRTPDGLPTTDGNRDRPKGKRGKPGLRIKPRLDLDDYKRIVGADVVEKEFKAAKRRASQRRGRWKRKVDAIQATFENFTPDIRPGNQTALKTRAAPFAVYIARMHRGIHKRWGFGYLKDLNAKSPSDPLNDWSLQTIVEIVIKGDGTVGKTTIVRTSGRSEFDVAAVHTVLSAAPYGEPPTAIRSKDGNTYLHWVFRRDWQQCGTFNVRPYIRGK